MCLVFSEIVLLMACVARRLLLVSSAMGTHRLLRGAIASVLLPLVTPVFFALVTFPFSSDDHDDAGGGSHAICSEQWQ